MRLIRSMILGTVLALLLTKVATAEPPRYIILRTPPTPAEHRPTYGYYPGVAQPVHTNAYSYGWFGVQPRRHWSRHFGYYRQYREWSAH